MANCSYDIVHYDSYYVFYVDDQIYGNAAYGLGWMLIYGQNATESIQAIMMSVCLDFIDVCVVGYKNNE